MCNDRFKIQILKWLKRMEKNKVHCVSKGLLFDCKQISVAENHVRCHGYMTVSPVYITTDECTFEILHVTVVLHIRVFTAGL
jgi:hypothetical protein